VKILDKINLKFNKKIEKNLTAHPIEAEMGV
jgi:hypothetical protein